jgi:cell division protease FtsH
MVVKFGMSDEIGPIFLGSSQELFLGKEIGHTKTFSEELAYRVDVEVKRLLDNAYVKAQDILKENIQLLHKTAAVLIEREKIDGDEFDKLWNGEDLPPLNHDTGGGEGVPAQAPA